MIAVLASRLDKAARGLVEAWSSAGAVLVSAEDLCSPGWTWKAPDPGCGAFVAVGTARPVADLRGVVVRRPAVAAEELAWVHALDRQYVAAELNAFLVCWLDSLPCRVLNRPTATSLCGPGWSPLHWQLAARRSGVAWAVQPASGQVLEVTVCSQRVHGARTPGQKNAARRLASVSGAELLGIRYVGDAAAAVTTQPSLASPAVRDMVLGELTHAKAAAQ